MAPTTTTDDCAVHQGGWALLPDNLLDDISRRLPVLSAITMGRVCKPWQRILAERLPLSRRQGLPWLLLTDTNQDVDRPCFSILQRNFWNLRLPDALGQYCWGSVQDWLIIADHHKPPQPYSIHPSTLAIHLCNPFSGSKILLPPIAGDRYNKLLLSASPDDPNCLFLLLGDYDQSIACWTPAVPSWRRRYRRGIAFRDSVFCDGRFYFLTPDYNIHTLDPHVVISSLKQPCDPCDLPTSAIHLPLRPHQVAIPERPAPPSDDPPRHYLVESCGEVLMVCRLFGGLFSVSGGKRRDTHSFEVFKLDSRKMVWNKMPDLGDRVLFVAKSDSRSFSAKHLGADLANRIFFFKDFFLCPINEWNKAVIPYTTTPPRPRCTFMDWGYFSLDTKCFAPTGSTRASPQSYPPIWITAPVWWFFTAASTEKHQCVNVARRTGKSIRLLQQEKNKKKATLKRMGKQEKNDACQPQRKRRH